MEISARSRPESTARFSVRRFAFEPESDSHFDLEGRVALLANRASDIFDLEPVDITYRLARLGDRIAHCLVEAVVRNSYHLDYLERLVRHGILLCTNHPH